MNQSYDTMNKNERVVKIEGKDTGVRENGNGAMYINHRVFFSNDKVKLIIKNLSCSAIVREVSKNAL